MDKVSDNTDFKSEHPQVYRRLFGDSCTHSRAATEPRRTNFVTVVSEVYMATTGYGIYKIASCEGRSARNDHGARVRLSHIRSKKGVRERTTRKKRRQDNEIK